MKRRSLLQGVAASAALLSMTCAAPAVDAKRKLRLGAIDAEAPPADGSPPLWGQEVSEGLRDEGYVDGKNMTIEYRHTDGNNELNAVFANEFIRLPVDFLIAEISAIVLAMKAATSTIPIVMSECPEPVEIGLIQSYAHPGVNVTGTAFSSIAEAAKRLELLREAFPAISRVAVIGNNPTPVGSIPAQLTELRRVAVTMGVQLIAPEVLTDEDLPRALNAAGGADALLVIGSPITFRNRDRIASFAIERRLPAVYSREEQVTAGGLMSYGSDRTAGRRRVGSFVRRIAEGASPGDLPVQLPSKFVLAVNLATAAHAGLSLPASVLARATTVVR